MTLIRERFYRQGDRPQRREPSYWWKYFAIGAVLGWALYLLVEAARFARQVAEYGWRP